jgi:nicotinamidase-related amidase
MRAPAINEDLHGMAPDTSDVALLLLDVINDLEFEGSDDLLCFIPETARRIAALKTRARAAGIPTSTTTSAAGAPTSAPSSPTAAGRT